MLQQGYVISWHMKCENQIYLVKEIGGSSSQPPLHFPSSENMTSYFSHSFLSIHTFLSRSPLLFLLPCPFLYSSSTSHIFLPPSWPFSLEGGEKGNLILYTNYGCSQLTISMSRPKEEDEEKYTNSLHFSHDCSETAVWRRFMSLIYMVNSQWTFIHEPIHGIFEAINTAVLNLDNGSCKFRSSPNIYGCEAGCRGSLSSLLIHFMKMAIAMQENPSKSGSFSYFIYNDQWRTLNNYSIHPYHPIHEPIHWFLFGQ